MRSFRTKRTVRSIVYSPIAAGILLVIVAGLAHAAWGAYGDYKTARENSIRARGELTELTARKQALESGIERLSTEKGIESELRRKYGVARLGESSIVIVNPKEELAKRQEKTTSVRWWNNFKSFFGF